MALSSTHGPPPEGHNVSQLKRKLRLASASVEDMVPMWSNNAAPGKFPRSVDRRPRGFARVEHLRELHVEWCNAGGDQSWFFARGRGYRCGRGDCGQLAGKRVQSIALPTVLERRWKPDATLEGTKAVEEFKQAKSQL